MKRIFTILTLFIFAFSITNVSAQRYETEMFDNVDVTYDVQYGVNGTILYIGQVGEIVPEALLCDVYEPNGDTETDRPLVLVFHNGNFLPPVTNGQISGLRSDSAVVEICMQLAKRGFVAASVSYRLGWNPLAASQPERALGLIQAAYRGVQDGRTAIRFFKKDALQNGNNYGINPNKVATWGVGTGGYLVLGVNALDDYNEILTTTNPAGKFLLDTDGDGVPETPMVAEAFHGDVNGEVTTVTPAVAYGLPMGDTTNYANHVGISNDHQLTIHVGGAIGDISWLADQTIPIISIQNPFDIFAPYDDAVLIVPTTGDPIVQVQGAKAIGTEQEASGINQAWKDYNLDDAMSMTAATNSTDVAMHDYFEGTFPFVRPVNSAGIPEGVVLNWWEPTAPAPLAGMGIPWNQLPHPSGGTFHDQGLVLNEGMSAAKSRANLADVMNYVIPRACITLDLGCTVTSLDEITLDQNLISVAPNPAIGFVTVNAFEAEVITSIEVYNVEGRLMSATSDINATSTTVDLNNQTTGMYIMKVYTENGFVAKKLMVK